MASWRTRLITIAKGAVHIVRSRGARAARTLVRHQGHRLERDASTASGRALKAFSLTEDLEYGIDLGLAGFRVAYADESTLQRRDGLDRAECPDATPSVGSAVVSRLMRSKTKPLLMAALRRHSALCLDLALDLLVLPISYVGLIIAALNRRGGHSLHLDFRHATVAVARWRPAP